MIEKLIYESVPRTPYCEIKQSVQLRFAFLNKKDNVVRELFYPVMCRDYLSDILHAEFFNLDAPSIYGFKYNAHKKRIDRDKLRMSIQSPSKTIMNLFKKQVLELLNPIEDQNGFAPSRLIPAYHTIGDGIAQEVLTIEGDAKWLHNSFLLATYTLLMRISGLPFKKIYNWADEIISLPQEQEFFMSTDKYFVKLNNRAFERILPNLNRFIKLHDKQKASPTGWNENSAMGIVHNQSGVNSTLSPISGLNPILQKIAMEVLNQG